MAAFTAFNNIPDFMGRCNNVVGWFDNINRFMGTADNMADAFALLWPPLVWGGKHAKRDVFSADSFKYGKLKNSKFTLQPKCVLISPLITLKVNKIQTESSALYAFMVSCGISSEWEFPHGHHKFYFSPLPLSK